MVEVKRDETLTRSVRTSEGILGHGLCTIHGLIITTTEHDANENKGSGVCRIVSVLGNRPGVMTKGVEILPILVHPGYTLNLFHTRSGNGSRIVCDPC